MSYSLNSLKWVIWGIIQGTALAAIKGDTRSLDYGSYGSCSKYLPPKWSSIGPLGGGEWRGASLKSSGFRQIFRGGPVRAGSPGSAKGLH